MATTGRSFAYQPMHSQIHYVEKGTFLTHPPPPGTATAPSAPRPPAAPRAPPTARPRARPTRWAASPTETTGECPFARPPLDSRQEGRDVLIRSSRQALRRANRRLVGTGRILADRHGTGGGCIVDHPRQRWSGPVWGQWGGRGGCGSGSVGLVRKSKKKGGFGSPSNRKGQKPGSVSQATDRRDRPSLRLHTYCLDSQSQKSSLPLCY